MSNSLKKSEEAKVTKQLAIPLEPVLGSAVLDDATVKKSEEAKVTKQLAIPLKPVLGSAVLDDATVESLAPLLAVNPRGLLIAKDEGVALVQSFNQYKKGGRGSDRQFFLSVLMGKPVRVDRKGQTDGLPILIDHPFLGIIGNVPPDLLSEFREKREANDGFIERILFAFPDPRPRPLWSKEGVADSTLERWAEIVSRLRAMEMSSKNGEPCPYVVSFTPEAERLWVDWYNSHVEEVNSPGFDEQALAGEVKLVDFAGRFVLILHLLTLACDRGFKDGETIPPVPPSIVDKAIQLWRYFRSHQSRVRWHLDGGIGNRQAGRILRWIRRSRVEQFTLKEVNDNIRSRPGENENALVWMEGRGLVRPLAEAHRPKGMRGKKPSPGYEVNPDIHEPHSLNSQYSRFRALRPPNQPPEQDLREYSEYRECNSQDETVPPESGGSREVNPDRLDGSSVVDDLFPSRSGDNKEFF